MPPGALNPPPAFDHFPSLNPPHRAFNFHKFLVFAITFLAYASFHASRKPPSIVKSVLAPTNSTSLDTGWAPFNGSKGPHRLGELDLAFLSSYAIGMYCAGHFGDRLDLRLFLVFGMMGSGVFTIVFGLGYFLNVHSFSFFVGVQLFCGLFQSIGWPCVVAVVGNWSGKANRGSIMGIWNSHTSVGNIVGSFVASAVVESGWGWSFVLPGVLVILFGILVFFFLAVQPQDLGLELLNETEINVERTSEENSQQESEDVGLLRTENESDSHAAIGFFQAWKLPSVAQYAFCLFFSKLVAYTFLYWLPFYIRNTVVAGKHLKDGAAGNRSTAFDCGGVIGGILAGHISDKIGARATTSALFLLLSMPTILMFHVYGSVSQLVNIILMVLCGSFVNGPYALITTAVAADLGTQEAINGNSRALATVTAIIDGTGSVGAAVGPLLAGYLSTIGWEYVFTMLIISIFVAFLLLVRIVITEIRDKINNRVGL